MKNLYYSRLWFLTLMQVTAFIITLYAIFNPAEFEYWMLSLLGYFLISCLGITVTFHRLLTHHSYKLWRPLEYLFEYFGILGCTGSPVEWVVVHRKHHKHADHEGDPHSPVTMGAWGAFVGDYGGSFNKWEVKDIISIPGHRFLHEHYIPLVLLPAIIMAYIDPQLVIYFYFIPIFGNTMVSRLSNWVNHNPKFGKRINDNTNDQAHNVWWWSIFSFGEGWHDNHHTYPWDYRMGHKWYEFDPGRYVIETLMFLKLASKP